MCVLHTIVVLRMCVGNWVGSRKKRGAETCRFDSITTIPNQRNWTFNDAKRSRSHPWVSSAWARSRTGKQCHSSSADWSDLDGWMEFDMQVDRCVFYPNRPSWGANTHLSLSDSPITKTGVPRATDEKRVMPLDAIVDDVGFDFWAYVLRKGGGK